jgi:putative tricarboxylic transport membrane protein
MSRDGVTGLVVFAASLVLFALTLGLKQNPMVPVGPGFYPRIVLGIAAVIGIALVATDLLRRRASAPVAAATRGERLNYPLVALVFVVFGLYAVALPLVGFRIATFAFAAALNLVLDRPRSIVHVARALAFGVITAASTYYAFEHYLSVLLPRGSWTGF